MRTTCIFCFGRWDNDDTLVPIRLEPPPEYPSDLATIIAGYCRDDGTARICPACAVVAEHAQNDAAIADFLIRSLLEQPWFQRASSGEREGIVGMVTIVQYAWRRTHRGLPPDSAAPGLRYIIELCRRYPMLPPPADRAVHGANEVLSRDVGLGCYLSAAPHPGKIVLFIDFASKAKGKGYGGIVFRQLLALADQCETSVVGVVEAHGAWGGRKNALSNAQLLRWYQRFGFNPTGASKGNHLLIARAPR